MNCMGAYIFICVLIVAMLAAMGILLFATEGVEKILEESESVESTESNMETSDCVTLCNSAFARADDRLLCHEQCHEKYD